MLDPLPNPGCEDAATRSVLVDSLRVTAVKFRETMDPGNQDPHPVPLPSDGSGGSCARVGVRWPWLASDASNGSPNWVGPSCRSAGRPAGRPYPIPGKNVNRVWTRPHERRPALVVPASCAPNQGSPEKWISFRRGSAFNASQRCDSPGTRDRAIGSAIQPFRDSAIPRSNEP
jgi:hypothetical protein